MIERTLSQYLQKSASQWKAVALTGPRQSGKTMLARHLFAHKPYATLEDPETFQFAAEDPRGFWRHSPQVRFWTKYSECRNFFRICSAFSMRPAKRGCLS